MTLFNIKYLKTIAAVGAMVFFVSCSNDIVTDTGGIIDNESFSRETITVPLKLTTKAIDLSNVRTDRTLNYLLGSYIHPDFGMLKADFVGQVTPNGGFPSAIDENTVLQSAELVLPLNLVQTSSGVFEVPNFLGDFTSRLSLEVKTFENFLELFNVDGQFRTYYANGTNNGNNATDLGNETLLGNLTDVEIEEQYDTEESIVKVPLDVDFFKTEVIEKAISERTSNPSFGDLDFIQIFKGIRINATNTGDGSILPFNIMSQAKVNLIYTNTIEESDATIVEKRDTLVLDFDRVNKNLYSRNHITANVANERYVQGAGGYEVSVDLEEFIAAQRSIATTQDWFINQATLTVFTKEVVPETLNELYVYGINSDGEAVAISDYGFANIENPVGGIVKDVNGENPQGFVQFFITNHVRDILLSGLDIKELRIKLREPSESTVVSNSSIDARGIVLLSGDENADKAPKLEVIFSTVK